MELIKSTLGALLGMTFLVLIIKLFCIVLEKLGWYKFIEKLFNK